MRQTVRQTVRQTDRQTVRQTDRKIAGDRWLGRVVGMEGQ